MILRHSIGSKQIGLGIILLLSFLLCISTVYGEKVPTRITLAVTPEHPSLGMPYTITGTLTSEQGDPLGNKRVILEATESDPADETSFVFFAMDDTDPNGVFSFFRPKVSGERAVRVVFLGNNRFDAVVSSGIVIDPSPVPPSRGTGKTGNLMVMTDPDGAMVFIDEVFSGITPATLSLLPEGDHKMIVSMEGYQNETVDVFVVPGKTTSVSVSLNPAWLGYTRSGATAVLEDTGNTKTRIDDPVFSYSQNNLDLTVYQNVSSPTVPRVTTIYSKDPIRNGYSLSLIVTDDT